MKEIQFEELRQIELKILVKIDEICRTHGWDYSLCGGTLLGAVRHKGFIPWDDDIDIAMPRKDYEIFLKYLAEHSKALNLNVVSSKNSKHYAYLAAKVCDASTIMEEMNFERSESEMGVYVDIFPIDGLGDKAEAKAHFNATRFERELLVAKNWKKFFLSKTHAWYIEPIRFVFWLMSRFISIPKLVKKVEDYYLQFPLETSEYAAVVCGSYRTKEILSADVLTTYADIDFEGRKFMAFKDYHAYLSNIYGKYMELPPIDKRVSHHMFKAYWKE